MPLEHYLGRLSEEFGGALPSEIWAEWQRLPAGMLEQIIEYRNYAAAKHANDVDPKGASQGGPMRQLAMEIEFALVQEGITHAAR